MAKSVSKKRRGRKIVLALLVVIVAAIGVFAVKKYRTRDEIMYRKGMLYLQSDNAGAALEQFERALKVNPNHEEARFGRIRALTARKEYGAALKAIDVAIADKLDPTELALLRANLYTRRADNRLKKASNLSTIEMCDEVIAQDADPAIAALRAELPHAPKPGEIHNAIGDMLAFKGQVQLLKWQLTLKERDEARSVQNAQGVAEYEAAGREALLAVRDTQRAAMTVYEQAIVADPRLPEPRLSLARYHLTTYHPKPQEARNILEPLLERKPVRRDALLLLAAAERELADYDKALEHIRLARQQEKNPKSTVGMLDEVETLIAAQRWKEAEPLCDELVKKQAKDLAVGFAAGRVYLEVGREAEAVTYFTNLFERKEFHWAKARFYLARALERTGRAEQARSTYFRTVEDIEATQPHNIRVAEEFRDLLCKSYISIVEHSRKDDPKNAFLYARKALSLRPSDSQLMQLVRDTYPDQLEPPERLEEAVLIHAATLASIDQTGDAVAVLRQEIEKTGGYGKEGRMGLVLARMLVAQGEYRDAITLCEKLRHEYPKTVAISRLLADLSVRFKRYDDAEKVYRDLMAANPGDTRSVASLVMVLLQAGKSEAARELVQELDRRGGSEQLSGLMMALAIRERRVDDAIALARVLVETNPSRGAAPHVLLAELLRLKGEIEPARAAYDTALQVDPKYAPAYRRAMLDLEDGRAADAVTLLRAAAEHFPKDFSFRATLAVALQAQGAVADATAILTEISALSKTTPQVMDVPRLYLAFLHAGTGNLAAAQAANALIGSGVMGMPADRELLLKHISEMDEPARAQAALALNRMVLFHSAGYRNTARSEVQAAQKLLPDEPLVACWHGTILDAMGDHDGAVASYRQAIKASPQFLLPRTLLANSFQRNRQLAEARDTIEDALQVAPPIPAAWLQLKLGKLYEDLGDLDKAVASYRNALALSVTRPQACNNLAWLYATRKQDMDAALPLAEEAARLAPNHPLIGDTLGWVLYLKGQNGQALGHLEKARTALPQEPTIRYHYGMALLKAGRKDEAKAEFQEALTISSEFPEADETEQALVAL